MADSVPAPGVAVVGCGAWGRNHVRTFAALGALRAVSDVDGAAAGAAGAAAGVPVRDFAALLADKAVAALVIAAPDALHAALAARALEAGKHLLVEKPLAMTVADAEALAAAARARGRVLMAGHVLRYHAAFRRLLGLIAEDALGPLSRLVSERRHRAPPPPRHALWDLCPHDVSMILAAAGDLPTAVRAVAEDAGPPLRAGRVMMDFAGGLAAEIAFSAVEPVKLHRFTARGAVGEAVFEDSKPWEDKLTLRRRGAGGLGPPEAVTVEPGEPLAEEARAFLAAIAGGPAPPSAAPEGIAVVRVLAAAERALHGGGAEAP